MSEAAKSEDLSRSRIVADLIRCRVPVEVAVRELGRFSWDSEAELGTLDTAALRAVLDRYLDGSLPAAELEAWANAVEGRDDIAFDPPELVDEIAELANPLLYQAEDRDGIIAGIRRGLPG